MPSYLRICAIISIILSISLPTVSVSTGPSLSSTCLSDGHQDVVKHNSTTAQVANCAHPLSGIKTIPLTAPLFRNVIMGSIQIDTNASFGLDARGGECQCTGINSKWRSHTLPGEELE